MKKIKKIKKNLINTHFFTKLYVPNKKETINQFNNI